ncbi:hypothetical protein J2Y40_001232 [Chryseobacterium sp. 2987]|nr:hypothetical protein [Chryseobacterium sp. 2987]
MRYSGLTGVVNKRDVKPDLIDDFLLKVNYEWFPGNLNSYDDFFQ